MNNRKRSLPEKFLVGYHPLFITEMAFEPTSCAPDIILVKWTLKNGTENSISTLTSRLYR